MAETEIKQEVREFYDQVGWQMVGSDNYQNARYEDLRPVSRSYIHKGHLRVARHLKSSGHMLLDAGSGPVQYPEYLVYSQGFDYRVCADISIVALQEARKRLGARGLYVVADVANLPFKPDAFDGVVSLHTFHHLPAQDQGRAYREVYRVMAPGRSAVIVNGWTESPLLRRLNWLVTLMEKTQRLAGRVRGRKLAAAPQKPAAGEMRTGTFIHKFDAAWLKQELGGQILYQIFVWRSVNVRFLRAVIHSLTGGRFWLALLYWLEERFPRYFGEQGQYPMIVIRKP